MVKRSGGLQGFLRKFPIGNYYCQKRGHAFAVIDGVAHDCKHAQSHIQCAYKIEKISMLVI